MAIGGPSGLQQMMGLAVGGNPAAHDPSAAAALQAYGAQSSHDVSAEARANDQQHQ